jgi:hypothetical protein
VADLRSLPAVTLQRALSAGNIDHRHCIEKSDLASALHSSFDHLPLDLRSEITSLIKAPKHDLATVDVQQALLARVTRLQQDEQYSVKLFQVRLRSCSAQAPVFLLACTLESCPLLHSFASAASDPDHVARTLCCGTASVD